MIWDSYKREKKKKTRSRPRNRSRFFFLVASRSRACFFLTVIVFYFFLDRFLGRERVFSLFSWPLSFLRFFLIVFLVESVFSFFLKIFSWSLSWSKSRFLVFFPPLHSAHLEPVSQAVIQWGSGDELKRCYGSKNKKKLSSTKKWVVMWVDSWKQLLRFQMLRISITNNFPSLLLLYVRDAMSVSP